MAIKVFAEAACNLFKDLLKRKNVDVTIMNMRLIVGDNEYNCYDDIEDIKEFSKEYFEKIEQGVKVRTSLVSPGEYEKAFKKEVEQGNQVICYTMAKGISGTYESACMARDMINEEFKGEFVYVIDSGTCGLGEGLQVLHAYELTKQDKKADELVKELEEYKSRVRSEFTVDNIKYLLGTGRVNKFLSKFLNLVNFKVLLKSRDSKIGLAGNAIGRSKSIKKLAAMVLDKIDVNEEQTIYITHCAVPEDAEILKNILVEGGLKAENIEIEDYDLISGAHIGPRSLAVFYLASED